MIRERLADRLLVRPSMDQPINRPIDAGLSGDNIIVQAAPGLKIRVLSYVLVAAAAVTVQWQSGITGQNSFRRPLSGAMSLAVNGSLPSPSAGPDGWLFETDAHQDLILNLGGAQNVRGHLTFVYSPD